MQTFSLRRLVLQTGISGKYKLPSVFSFFIYLFIVSVFLLLSSLYVFLLSIKMFSGSDQHKILWHFSLFFHYLFYYCYVFVLKKFIYKFILVYYKCFKILFYGLMDEVMLL